MFTGSFSVILNHPHFDYLKGRGSSLFANDLDQFIWSLYYAYIQNPEKLVDRINLMIRSEALYNDFKDNPHSEKLSPVLNIEKLIDCIIQEYYVTYNTYGSLPTKSGKFNFPTNVYTDILPTVSLKKAEETSNLLRHIFLYRLDYKQFAYEMTKSGKKVFFYVDPPYVEIGERYYKEGFVDLNELYKTLVDLDAMGHYWLLSYNKRQSVLDKYERFYIHDEIFRYTFPKSNGGIYMTELLITNYKIKKNKSFTRI